MAWVKFSATVPFTSQLTWWLRSFGKKIQKIEPEEVAIECTTTQ